MPKAKKNSTETSSAVARSKVSGIRARRPEEKQIVREQILRNAIELYRELGYQGFSMRKLAARAGFSPAALYRYFDNKEAVFAGLVDLGFVLMEQRLSQVITSLDEGKKDFKSYLIEFAQAYLNFALDEPDLYKLMTTDHPPTQVKLEDSTTERRWSVFAAFGERADELGFPLLKSTVENSAATDAFWAFGHGLASLAVSLPYFDRERMQRSLDFIIQLVEPLVDNLVEDMSMLTKETPAKD